MWRVLVLFSLCCLPLAGCASLAEAMEQDAARRQAYVDGLRERVAALDSEEKEDLKKCASISVGKVKTLRNAGQGAMTKGVTDYTIIENCLVNSYYYETIPTPAAPAPAAQSPTPSYPSRCTTTMSGNTAYTNCD